MDPIQRKLSGTFNNFFDSEKSSGVLLIVCTVISLLIANSSSGADHLSSWHTPFGGLSVEHWTNDALMPILLASLTAGTIGFLWPKLLGAPEATDSNFDTVGPAGR